MNINVGDILLNLWNDSGFAKIASGFLAENGWQNLVMLAIACALLYLAIVADKMGKPINELRFLSIREVSE